MAGGTAEHNAAGLATATTFKHPLKGSPSKTFIGDINALLGA